jgi:3D (Asp-Asp-Asp) domain-containing protein
VNVATAYHHTQHRTAIVKPTPQALWRTVYLTITAYVIRHDPLCDTYVGRTASGSIAKVGTVAVSPRQFPWGTQFRIPGYGRGVAEDSGGAIVPGTLDVAVTTCRAAFQWGRRTLPVQVRVK